MNIEANNCCSEKKNKIFSSTIRLITPSLLCVCVRVRYGEKESIRLVSSLFEKEREEKKTEEETFVLFSIV